ncbi:MAG: hypothetical protein P8X98_11290 [Woeseiaceae bacterium]
MSFIAELRRRNVFKAGIAYVLVAWLILQAGDVLGPALRLPEWSNSLLAFFLILGFPIVLVFAWAFELTPDGFRPETGNTSQDTSGGKKGRILDVAVIVLLLVAAGYFFWESRLSNENTEPGVAEPPQTEIRTDEPRPIRPAVNKIAVLPFANVWSSMPSCLSLASRSLHGRLFSVSRISQATSVRSAGPWEWPTSSKAVSGPLAT